MGTGLRAVVLEPVVLRGKGFEIGAGTLGNVVVLVFRGGEAVDPLLLSSFNSENEAEVDLLFQISGRGGDEFCSRNPPFSIGSGVFVKFRGYESFAGVRGGGGVGGEVGPDSRVVEESIVEVLISEVLREIVGVAVATVVADGDAIDKEGVTGNNGEVVTLAKAADSAFCSAVIPNGRLGIAGGLSKARLSAGEGAGGSGELSLVEVVERAGDRKLERSTC
jgi:hypothetical protein